MSLSALVGSGREMPPKGDDATPGDRLLVLYQMLTLDDRRHFLTDLAQGLGRSPQSVNRMIEAIEPHLGKDAFIERGMEGKRRYFRLRSKSEEKGLGFGFEELRFLANCVDLAGPRLPPAVAERIGRTLTALALQLGEQPQELVGDSPISFRGKGYIDYAPHLEKLSTLRDAISHRKVCLLRYRANGREESVLYRYAPGRVVASGGTLYVRGHKLHEGSLLKGRPTVFSLHRIETVSLTGEYFGFDADGDEDPGAFGLRWHEPKRVSVHVDAKAADYVRDRVWSDDQTIEEHPDGSIILTVSTTSEKELQAWVWSFGDLVRMLT